MDDSLAGFPQALSDAVDADRFVGPSVAVESVPDAELPAWYGSNRLTLLVRDPLWIFAFWELAYPPPPPLWLNVYRLDPEGRPAELVGAHAVGASGRFHLPVPLGGARYMATLHAGGEPFPRLVSNAVTTPPGEPSSLEDEAWITLKALYSWTEASGWGGSSPGFERLGRSVWLAEGSGGSPMPTRRKRSWGSDYARNGRKERSDHAR